MDQFAYECPDPDNGFVMLRRPDGTYALRGQLVTVAGDYVEFDSYLTDEFFDSFEACDDNLLAILMME